MDGANQKLIYQTSSYSRRVLSIHGIRTTGGWQKDLNDALEESDLKHSPLDYGFFSLIMLLRPRRREEEIDRFRDQVSRYIENDKGIPSVIAHSFGSYIVAKSLLKLDKGGIYFDTSARLKARVMICKKALKLLKCFEFS